MASAGRTARTGDADAELQLLRNCALVRADTGEEVLLVPKIRGLRFQAESYELRIGKPGSTMTAVSCCGRTAYLKLPAWGKEWCRGLADLLAVPEDDAVLQHISALINGVNTSRWDLEFAAQRALSRWGAAALLPLLAEEGVRKSATNEERKQRPSSPLCGSHAGDEMRSRLSKLVRLAPKQRQPQSYQTVTIVVQDREP